VIVALSDYRDQPDNKEVKDAKGSVEDLEKPVQPVKRAAWDQG
jgi:hypothetical protein